ncbi:hypothetical protein FOA52_004492 [Chlamydomonas sp. UWO 241]|nr:hypothetical protein FOA52_004492 [Chlamydomonas sp. UWO 241]
MTSQPHGHLSTALTLWPGLSTLAASSCPEALRLISAAPLPRLQKLSVSYKPLPPDEWSVAKLSSTAAAGLRELHMRSTHERLRPCLSIEAVASFAHLTKLSLEGSTIPDLSPLGQLGQLVELCIEGSRMADLSPVVDCTQIVKLSLEGSKWPALNLTQLRSVPHLRELNISKSQEMGCVDHKFTEEKGEEEDYKTFHDREEMQLTNLEGIQACTGLERLQMTGCDKVTSIAALSACAELKYLNLVISTAKPRSDSDEFDSDEPGSE